MPHADPRNDWSSLSGRPAWTRLITADGAGGINADRINVAGGSVRDAPTAGTDLVNKAYVDSIALGDTEIPLNITLASIEGVDFARTGEPGDVVLNASLIPSLDGGNPHRMLGDANQRFLEGHFVTVNADNIFGPPAEGGTAPRRVLLEGDVSGGVAWDDVESKPDWVDQFEPVSSFDYNFNRNLIVTHPEWPTDAHLQCTGDLETRNLYVESQMWADVITCNSVIADGTVKIQGTPTDPQHAVPKSYVDALLPAWVDPAQSSVAVSGFAGTELLGVASYDAPSNRITADVELDMQNRAIRNVGSPVQATDAVTKGYVDGILGAGTPSSSKGVFLSDAGLKITSAESPEAFDSKTGTLSLWFRRTTGFLTTNDHLLTMYTDANNFWNVEIRTTDAGPDKLMLVTRTAGGFQTIESTPIDSSVDWHHVAVSWNTATGVEQMYVNGVSALASNTFTLNRIVKWNEVGVSLGVRYTNEANAFRGDLAEVWVTNEYVDLSTGISKFISAGFPASLGIDGSAPTGTQPKIYFSGGPMNFNAGVNFGSWADADRIVGVAIESSTRPSLIAPASDVPAWVHPVQSNVAVSGFAGTELLGVASYDAPSNRIVADVELNMQDHVIKNVGAPVNTLDATNKTYVDSALASKLSIAELTPIINGTINTCQQYTDDQLAAAAPNVPAWVDPAQSSVAVSGFAGTELLGVASYDAPSNRIMADVELNMQNHVIKNVAAPMNSLDAVNRTYAEVNFAKISSVDNRLILEDAAGTSTLPCFTVGDVGPSMAPPEASHLDIIALDSITPVTNAAYNLGQYGNAWRNTYTNNVITNVILRKSGGPLLIGTTAPDAATSTSWMFSGDDLLPLTSDLNHIGSPAQEVNGIYSKNLEVSTGGYIGSLDVDQLSVTNNLAMNLARITNLQGPVEQTDAATKGYVDTALAAQQPAPVNDIVPSVHDTYDIGKTDNYWKRVFATDVTCSSLLTREQAGIMNGLVMFDSRIQLLSDPINSDDAATKGYVDNIVVSQSNWFGIQDKPFVSVYTEGTPQNPQGNLTNELNVLVHLTPESGSTLDLGSATNRWSKLYVNNMIAGTASCSNFPFNSTDLCNKQYVDGLLTGITWDGLTAKPAWASVLFTDSGDLQSDILPEIASIHNIGSVVKPFQNAYVDSVNAERMLLTQAPTLPGHAVSKSYVDANTLPRTILSKFTEWEASVGSLCQGFLQYVYTAQPPNAIDNPQVRGVVYLPVGASTIPANITAVHVRYFCQSKSVSGVIVAASTSVNSSHQTWQTSASGVLQYLPGVTGDWPDVKFSVTALVSIDGYERHVTFPFSFVIESWGTVVASKVF